MDVVDKIKTRVVGVDLNMATTTYALVDVKGNVLAKDSFPTTDHPDANEFVTALSEKIIMMVEEHGGYETVRSVGISAPSSNFLTGCIENPANLPWKGVTPLAAMLRDRLGIAVGVGNDAHVSALGEKVFGTARGLKDFILVSIGHGGVGSCIFTDNQPHLGALGFAGEIGHTCVEEDGRLCGCGHKGCLETYCSAKGLVRTAEELMAEATEPTLLSELEDLTPETIAECCEEGDRLAIEVYRKAGFWLGLGLANYASLLNPQAIILTGDMTLAGDWLLRPMRESFEDHVFHNLKGKVRILVSILRDGERDILGASALAWGVKEYSLFK